MILLGLQYSVFHGSNSLNHHSSLQRQTENCSREVHGHIQTLSDEEAYVDSSAHILALNIEDAKKPRFLQIINNKIKILLSRSSSVFSLQTYPRGTFISNSMKEATLCHQNKYRLDHMLFI